MGEVQESNIGHKTMLLYTCYIGSNLNITGSMVAPLPARLGRCLPSQTIVQLIMCLPRLKSTVVSVQLRLQTLHDTEDNLPLEPWYSSVP